MKQMKMLAAAVAISLASMAALAQTTAPASAPAAGKARVQLDANKDGVIDRAEAAKAPRLAAQFDKLDTNKDGKLSADERRQWQGKRAQRGARDGRGGWMGADTDKDGRISRAEAQAAKGNIGGRFDAMDVNKDGYIDRADMRMRRTQRSGECFAKADTDKNGQLSRAEFDKIGTACAPMRPAMKGHPRNNPNPGPLPPKK